MSIESQPTTASEKAIAEEQRELIRQLRASEQGRIEFFIRMRPELKRLVDLRMNRKLASRIDASDVVQEAYVQYMKSIDAYLESPAKPPRTWIRHLARDALARLRRFHLESQRRDAHRELNLDCVVESQQLANTLSSVGNPAHQEELRVVLLDAFERMSETDREILSMVHLEAMTLADVTAELGLNHENTRKRYRRAINRLSSCVDKSQLEVFLK